MRRRRNKCVGAVLYCVGAIPATRALGSSDAQPRAVPQDDRDGGLRRPARPAPPRPRRHPGLPARARHARPRPPARHAVGHRRRVRRPADDAARQHPAPGRPRPRAPHPEPGRRALVPARAHARGPRDDEGGRPGAARRLRRGRGSACRDRSPSTSAWSTSSTRRWRARSKHPSATSRNPAGHGALLVAPVRPDGRHGWRARRAPQPQVRRPRAATASTAARSGRRRSRSPAGRR